MMMMLSTDEDVQSQQQQQQQAESGEWGQYDQKSIRYTGRNIPSRSFRILQNMTGADDASSSPGNISPVDWLSSLTDVTYAGSFT